MGEPTELTGAHDDAPHPPSSPITSVVSSTCHHHHPHQKGIRRDKGDISIFRLLAMHLIDILVPNFLMSVTSSLELPLITLLGRQYGFNTSYMAQVIALVSFCRALLDVPWGVLIELCGLRFMIMSSLLLNIVAAMVGFYFHTSFSLILFAVLSSSTIGGFFLTMDVFTARVVPRNHRGTVMSTISGVVRWAHVLGPTLTGIIISWTGDVRYAFWLSVATASLTCLDLLYGFRPRRLPSDRSDMGTEEEKCFHHKRKLERRGAEAGASSHGRSKDTRRKNGPRNEGDHENDVGEKASNSDPASSSSHHHSFSGSPRRKETVLSTSGVVPMLISTSSVPTEKVENKSNQTTSVADHGMESGVALSGENLRKEDDQQEPSPVVLSSLEKKGEISSVPSVTTTAPFSSSDAEKRPPFLLSPSPPRRESSCEPSSAKNESTKTNCEATPLLSLRPPSSSSLPSNPSSPLRPISPVPSSLTSDRRHSTVSISHLTNTQPPSSSSLADTSAHGSSVASSPPRVSRQKVRSPPKEVKVISPSFHYGATDVDGAEQQEEGKPPKRASPLRRSPPTFSSPTSSFQSSIPPHPSRYRRGHGRHGRWCHSTSSGTHRHLLQNFLFYYHFSRPTSYPDGIHYRTAQPSFASHRHHRSHSPKSSSRYWSSKQRGLHGRMRGHGGMLADRKLGPLLPMTSSAMSMEGPCHSPGFFQMLNQYKSTIFFLGCFVILLTGLRANRKLMLAFAVMDSHWSDENLAFLLSFGFCVDAVLFPLGGIVMDRLGRQWAMVPVTLGFALSFALLMHATTVPLLFAASALFGLVDSFGCGLVKTLVADRAPPHWGPPFFGIMRMLEDVGHVLGAAGVGRVLHAVGFSRTCFVLSVTGIFTALWGILLIPPAVVEEGHHERHGKHDCGSVHRSNSNSSNSSSNGSKRSSCQFSSGSSNASFASRIDSAASTSSACFSGVEYSSASAASQEKSKKEEAVDAHHLV